jgi:septum formation protein
MTNVIPQIYLASKSPRRRKLLKQIAVHFKSLSVDLNEDIIEGEHPVKTVKRLALDKSDAAIKKIKSGIIITADTIVVLNNEIIGKPKNKKNAFDILSRLSGKTHAVYTGFVIYDISTGRKIVDYEKTKVTFRKLLPEEIRSYIETGSPMDKAGAYGIQDDFGAVFVEKINGCYYNVVGLPLAKFYKRLMEFIQIA